MCYNRGDEEGDCEESDCYGRNFAGADGADWNGIFAGGLATRKDLRAKGVSVGDESAENRVANRGESGESTSRIYIISEAAY